MNKQFASAPRRYSLLLFAVYLFPLLVAAQEKGLPHKDSKKLYASRYGLLPRVGLSLGVNASHINEDYFGTKSRVGLYGGIKVEYYILPKVFLHTTIAYSSKGSISPFRLINSRGQLTEKEYEDKLLFSCIDFPILLGYKLGLKKGSQRATKVYPIVGMDQSYLIRAINKVPRLNQFDELTHNRFNLLRMQDPKLLNIPITTTNRYQVGVTLGVGTRFVVKEKYTFFVESRYSYFFTPVLVTMEGAKIYNRTITFNTGMFF